MLALTLTDDRGKLRSDSWGAQLSEEQRDAVFAKSQAALPWHEVARWAAEEFAVEPPARSSYYRFLDAWRPEYIARRSEERVFARDALREQARNLGDVSEENIFALETEANALVARGDYKAAERLYKIAQGIRDDVRSRSERDLRRLAEERAQKGLELRQREFEEKIRTDLERGLAALFERVRGNEESEQLVLKLQERVQGKAA